MPQKNIYYTTNYNEQFLNTEYFKKYPQQIPFVGKEFRKYKILIIAESCYLPEYSAVHLNDGWYNCSVKVLNHEEINWTSPVQIINDDFLHWDTLVSGHTIYNTLKNALEETLCMKNVFEYIAFYNFFQRPAHYTKSLDVTKIDAQTGNQMLREITAALQPELICVVSSKVRDYMKPDGNHTIIFTPHPATSWWNRRMKIHGDKSGRELFIEGIRKVIK